MNVRVILHVSPLTLTGEEAVLLKDVILYLQIGP